MMQQVLSTPYFYFSYTYDISHSRQRLDAQGSREFYQVFQFSYMISDILDNVQTQDLENSISYFNSPTRYQTFKTMSGYSRIQRILSGISIHLHGIRHSRQSLDTLGQDLENFIRYFNSPESCMISDILDNVQSLDTRFRKICQTFRFSWLQRALDHSVLILMSNILK